MAARKKAARAGGKSARKTKAAASKTAKKRKPTKTAKAAAASVARPARTKKATRGKAAPKRATTRRKTTRAKAARASASDATFPEISELAELMEQHGLVEVEFERTTEGDTRIHVRRAEAGAPVVHAPVMAAPAAPAAAAPAPAAGAEPAPAAAEDEGLHKFASPMVGTFYRAPSPEASPFSSVGDSVDPSQTVCIIEAMKVMNEITPDVAGEVVSIEVENGEAVEFGQTLMLIRPR